MCFSSWADLRDTSASGRADAGGRCAAYAAGAAGQPTYAEVHLVSDAGPRGVSCAAGGEHEPRGVPRLPGRIGRPGRPDGRASHLLRCATDATLSLLVGTHTGALRLIADVLGGHHAGLQIVAGKHSARLPPRMRKALMRLDIATAVARYISSASTQSFMCELLEVLHHIRSSRAIPATGDLNMSAMPESEGLIGTRAPVSDGLDSPGPLEESDLSEQSVGNTGVGTSTSIVNGGMECGMPNGSLKEDPRAHAQSVCGALACGLTSEVRLCGPSPIYTRFDYGGSRRELRLATPIREWRRTAYGSRVVRHQRCSMPVVGGRGRGTSASATAARREEGFAPELFQTMWMNNMTRACFLPASLGGGGASRMHGCSVGLVAPHMRAGRGGVQHSGRVWCCLGV